LTAERFVADPFSTNLAARLYKTGDKVRLLADGAVEFLGRFDDQVKIRGWRIEPREVERVLADHPGVRDTAVMVREDIPDEKRLVAYATPLADDRVTSEDLRRFLKERLPEYMMPSAVMVIDSLPLTANGKVDRKALPRPQAEAEVEGSYQGPRDPLQCQLTRIWEDLLGVHPISVRDNFFELGGHSLLAVKLVDEVKKACGRRLPLATLFATPTIERIADALIRAEENAPWTPLV